MFWSKNKKNRFTPAYPSFTIIKVGFKGVYIARTCSLDVLCCQHPFAIVTNSNQKHVVICDIIWHFGSCGVKDRNSVFNIITLFNMLIIQF